MQKFWKKYEDTFVGMGKCDLCDARELFEQGFSTTFYRNFDRFKDWKDNPSNEEEVEMTKFVNAVEEFIELSLCSKYKFFYDKQCKPEKIKMYFRGKWQEFDLPEMNLDLAKSTMFMCFERKFYHLSCNVLEHSTHETISLVEVVGKMQLEEWLRDRGYAIEELTDYL